MSRNHETVNATRRWRRLRREVLKRDGWRCCQCGKSGVLEVDHRVSLKDGGEAWAPSNLQTLCRSCHWSKTALENGGADPGPGIEQKYWIWYIDRLRTQDMGETQ